jgi:hypothetical protein
MSFDDSTGAIDRAHYASTVGIWGDSQGDRSIESLWDSLIGNRESAKLDSADRAAWLARQARKAARLDADAKRRRSAPVEAKIQAERIAQSKTAMGAAMRAALDKRDRQNGRERPEK